MSAFSAGLGLRSCICKVGIALLPSKGPAARCSQKPVLWHLRKEKSLLLQGQGQGDRKQGSTPSARPRVWGQTWGCPPSGTAEPPLPQASRVQVPLAAWAGGSMWVRGAIRGSQA